MNDSKDAKKLDWAEMEAARLENVAAVYWLGTFIDHSPTDIHVLRPGSVSLSPVKRGYKAVSRSLIGAALKELGSTNANARLRWEYEPVGICSGGNASIVNCESPIVWKGYPYLSPLDLDIDNPS